MCEGEKRKLVIPSELGYGASGAPPKIPKDATLIFNVELVKIERREDLWSDNTIHISILVCLLSLSHVDCPL